MLFSRLLGRDDVERGLVSFMVMFANVGFLGYPVAASIFGPEAVFYASLLNMPNTLFIFVFGVAFVKGGAASLRNFDWHPFLRRWIAESASVGEKDSCLLSQASVHGPRMSFHVLLLGRGLPEASGAFHAEKRPFVGVYGREG